MADWGAALSSLGGSISNLAGAAIKREEDQAAEERAADRKLADAERLLAIQEAMKMRAHERFSSVAKMKMEEQVPVQSEPVTSLTPESARASGLKNGLINVDPGQMAGKLQAILFDPNATPEQKADAQGILEQITEQAAAQKGLNEEAAAGKTRKRTFSEAVQAAREETALNDPAAFVAGESMFGGDRKAELEEKKLTSKEKMEQLRIEQRDRSDDKRFEAMMARIESATGGKGGNSTALIQNAEYLKTLGYSDDKIEKFIFEKKEIPLADLAAKIMAGDSVLTPQEAAQKAVQLSRALDASQVKVPDKQGASQGASPYPEGTPLRGKDGKTYVVKNGQPVLQTQAGRTSGGLINMRPQ